MDPLISSRAVIGMILYEMMQDDGMGWINDISMYFQSDQESENYGWFGNSPMMREWIGGRHAKGFSTNKLEVKNIKFEATIDVLLDWLRRDKTGQLKIRIAEMVEKARGRHWAKLILGLMVAGESTPCYDGHYFFDTDHVEGENSTPQSNIVQVDISTAPVSVHGIDAANPSPQEAAYCILKGIERIIGFTDDQNEPMNETASKFKVFTPITLMQPVLGGINNQFFGGGESNIVKNSSFEIGNVATPRLSAWTTKFVVLNTDGAAKPFLRQDEEEIKVSAKAEGSDYEFDNDAHQYGIKASRNAAYGYWQKAVLVEMT